MTASHALIVKYGSLAFLTIQNSTLILTLRYSRTRPGPPYVTSTAVLLSEILKCLTSLLVYLILSTRKQGVREREKQQDDETESLVASPVYLPLIPTSQQEITAFLPVLVPAFLYTIQNNLQFVAISNLDAATFSVAYQGKVLTTAACAVIFLKKRLSDAQAGYILLLTLGVALASLPPTKHAGAVDIGSLFSEQNRLLGIAAVGAGCTISGFAGVYTEIIFKATQNQYTTDRQNASILFWHRNYQLALTSVCFAFFAVFVHDRATIFEHGFLYGYSPVVWFAIFQQALGGVVVALVITHADNILKNFATSISVIISTLVSVAVWDIQLGGMFFLGMTAVLIATPMYAYADRIRQQQSPRSPVFQRWIPKRAL